VSEVSYSLFIENTPASPDVLAAIQQVEVEDHADMADMLRLNIAIGVKDGCGGYVIVDDDQFSPLANIKVLVTVGSGPTEPLIDAYVIETSATFSNQPGQSVFNVVAMDPTVKMNLKEKTRAHPNMADSDIATQIFNEHEFVPQVEQTQPSRQEIETTTIQRGTDMQFLRQLAQRNGFECYVEMNPLSGIIEGHFHRPLHPKLSDQTQQNGLVINMGEATNVNSFDARYDMLRPTTVKMSNLDIETHTDQQAQVESSTLAELGAEPVFNTNRLRQIILSQTGLAKTGELQTRAQAEVDDSAWAITADGELNAVAYGGILRAKRKVEVRGTGKQFSGTYYVEKVLHTFSGAGYTQRFTLRRNALGLTGQERFVEYLALPNQNL
jgi:phage protein D